MAARSAAYLKWIRQQPCIITGQSPCDAHHPKGHGLGGTVKCSDYFCIPLAHEEHMAFHAMGWRSWEAEHGSQLEYSARMMERYLDKLAG